MFDINKFYERAESGDSIDLKELLDYFKSFKEIVIWGAGNMGKALGENFKALGIDVDCFWDLQFEKMNGINTVPVKEPFSCNFDKEETLVVVGIVNGTQSHKWQAEQLLNHGFPNYMFGQQLYEAVGCKMNSDTGIDFESCTHTNICNFNTCKKYRNLLKKKCQVDETDNICLSVVDLIVSHRCSLDCYYCGQQLGRIKRNHPEHYVDYDLEQIKKDIDHLTEAVDTIGTFSVIGGEPFLNKNLKEIVEHCLTKENVGIISVTTNGVVNISEEFLRVALNPRVKLNFSNYTKFLSEAQRKLFYDNLEKARKMGVFANDATPIWVGGLCQMRDNPCFDAAYLTKYKKVCVNGPAICNGLFFECCAAEVLHKIDWPLKEEYSIDLEESNLRQKIKKMINRPFYEACGGPLCGNGKGVGQVPAGEQYDAFE